MTTIAVNRKEMACDSRVSWDSEFGVVSDKVQRVGDVLVGLSGIHNECAKFMAWFRTKGEAPEFDAEKGFEAVVLSSTGIDIYINGIYPLRLADPFYCTGSGGLAARGAMYCGKTPAEAVAIAIKCDKNSGPPVRTYKLECPRPRPKTRS